jgi:hypothetical protein
MLGSSGNLGGSYGSFTSYESPSHKAWSLVAQTSQAPRAQTLNVHIDSGLPDSAVHVWSTNLNTTHSGSFMFNRGTVHPGSSRSFSYTLKPGFIYTFTTTTGEGKGTASGPKATTMPVNYTATPDSDAVAAGLTPEPTDLAAQDGSFEYLNGSTSTFTQTTIGRPLFWQNPVSTRFPYAVLGGSTWKNYTVSTDVAFTAAGQNAGLITRFAHPKADGIAQQFQGYQFTLGQGGTWKLLRDKTGGGPTVLKTGTVAATPVNTPVAISLTASGKTLSASVNGTKVTSTTDGTWTTGDAGISTGGWYAVNFSSLKVS